MSRKYKYSLFCDKLSGYKSIGFGIGHDDGYIGLYILFWMIGIQRKKVQA